MWFQIKGAKRDTGEEATLHLEAVDQAMAAELAADSGYVVSSIRALVGPPAPPPVDQYRVAPQRSAARELEDAVARVPDYYALRFAGGALMVFGWMSVVLGGLCLVFALWTMGASNALTPPALESAARGVGALICGVLQIALGEAVNALRDLAMNSWYIRHASERQARHA